MKYIATQQTTNVHGIASFLVIPLDGSSYGTRMLASSINWSCTLLESEGRP